MEVAFKKTFSYLILAVILLLILKFVGPIKTDIMPYIFGVVVLSVILFFVYYLKEKNKKKRG